MKMVMNRDLVHVSDAGLSFRFQKDIPMEIPKRLVAGVMAIGGVMADDAETNASAKADIQQAQVDADNRTPAIEAAIQVLLKRNQRGDFTAGGKPNLNALAKETGFTIGAEELDPIWQKAKNDLA